MLRSRLARSIAWPLAAVVLAGAAAAAQTKSAAPPSPGKGTFYVSTYKGVIAVIDEATEKLVGEIPTKIGIPGDVTLSDDRSKLHHSDVTYEKIEIVDRVTKASIDTYTLSEGGKKVRIWGMQPDPHDKYLIMVIKNYELKTDRWEIGPPTLVQYDLATKKIARTIP